MCLDCGCNKPKDDHGDARHLVKKDFTRAAKASKLDMHHVIANITNAYDRGELGKGVEKLEAGRLSPFIQVSKEQVDRARKRENNTDAIPRVKIVRKSSDERRYTLGVVYAPDTPDVAVAVDGHQDQMTEEELEVAAWRFMTDHREIGVFHQDGTEGAATVVESYIYRGPQWMINDVSVEPGTWLLGVIWSPKEWAKVKAGLIKGFSFQGTGTRKEAV